MNTTAEILKFVGTFVGGSAVLLAALVWLLRTWFSHGLTRDLAVHQSALDRASAAESQRLRHDLELIAADVVKRTTMLNEKRAEIIAELYRLLGDFMAAAENYVSLGVYIGRQASDISEQKMRDASRTFFEYYRRNRIYFTEKLCKGLTEIHETVSVTVTRASMETFLEEETKETKEREKAAFAEAAKILNEKGPEMLSQIEKEFRDLLGVKDSDRVNASDNR